MMNISAEKMKKVKNKVKNKNENKVKNKNKNKVKKKQGEDEQEDIISSSQGNTLIVEGKESLRERYMPQLLSTTVVSPFTEHTLHPYMNTLVSVVMLNCSTVRICMYDCVIDALLLSDPISIRKNISEFGFILLWILLNHR